MSLRITAGSFRSMRLQSPGQGVRPTSDKVRQAVFSTILAYVQGAHVLDLFAGSGALGFEALSRGAASATFVDASKRCIDVIKKNAAALGVLERVSIVKAEAFSFVGSCSSSYGLIFVDPPYHKSFASDIARDVYKLLDIGGILVIEHESSATIPLPAFKQKRYGGTSITYVLKE
ncbi:MAG TPA: 16S rRNA (guanine(966)-N(2))-methyltransferase RsmD [Deltaproteobacteria bacterium]|nr:16S rRNA (guanine(966)-N(2))-methyltransferase RsmD [Deltaproteobacteria bacterium]HOM28734.1 16S rRNA (guanine(966)-N(2))-methyltransferase RsmD [Deltaproteobacteria bacterium]HPP79820.1 16S rRNA (guanine(966)-N(2))-methyltransferase RsmD [Deltaproteobacteria bacterium]